MACCGVKGFMSYDNEMEDDKIKEQWAEDAYDSTRA